MRFISQYPGLNVQVRPQRQRALGDGGVEVTQEGLYVKFDSVHDGAFIYENELVTALKHFTFHGNTQDQGEAMPTDPVLRLSLVDTDEWAERDGWTDDDRILVEQRLSELAGTSPDQVLVVMDTQFTAPYPAYDDYEGDGQALVIKLIEDGHDLERVQAYEKASYGPRRENVLMWLEDAIETRRQMEITA